MPANSPNTNNIEKYSTITRKIRLLIDISDNKEEFNRLYKQLYNWQKIVFKSANIITTHLYIQQNAKELIYFQEDIKLKLLNREKDDGGMLNTSLPNSTYRLIAQKFKTEIPSSIITCLNQNIHKKFSNDKNDYFLGTRSLSSYKRNIPIPFNIDSILNLQYNYEIKNFKFNLFNKPEYKIPFKTLLGKDLSENKLIIERCIKGEYKLCNSAITINDGEIYLLLSIKIPQIKHNLDTHKEAKAELSFFVPLVVYIDKKIYHLGNKESFLYKRLAIQQGLKRRQKLMKFNSGGKGRKKKIMGIDAFKDKEAQFVDNFTHTISRNLVDVCIKNNVGRLILNNLVQLEKEVEETPFVIRNWSFGNLITKIEYKCKMNGIELIK